MKLTRLYNGMKFFATGAVLLQFGGCNTTQFLEIVQTILLGVTAAGSYVLLRNF